MLTGRPPESRYDHRLWSADFTPPGNQDRATGAGEPYRESIKRGLGRGRNAMAILQDSVRSWLPHGYQTVKRAVCNRGSESLQTVGLSSLPPPRRQYLQMQAAELEDLVACGTKSTTPKTSQKATT
jgi:hypothetical protein